MKNNKKIVVALLLASIFGTVTVPVITKTDNVSYALVRCETLVETYYTDEFLEKYPDPDDEGNPLEPILYDEEKGMYYVDVKANQQTEFVLRYTYLNEAGQEQEGEYIAPKQEGNENYNEDAEAYIIRAYFTEGAPVKGSEITFIPVSYDEYKGMRYEHELCKGYLDAYYPDQDNPKDTRKPAPPIPPGTTDPSNPGTEPEPPAPEPERPEPEPEPGAPEEQKATVTHKYIVTTEDGTPVETPEKIKELVPPSFEVPYGEEATPKDPSETTVTTEEGTYTFKNYTEKTWTANEPTHEFTGSWVFTPKEPTKDVNTQTETPSKEVEKEKDTKKEEKNVNKNVKTGVGSMTGTIATLFSSVLGLFSIKRKNKKDE